MGWALSFTWNSALIFVHFARPLENTSGNFCLSSCLNVSVLVAGLTNLRQNMLIGQSQRLNFSIQSVPNRLSVFFSTYTMSFFVILFKVTLRTTSPKMIILSPVTNVLSFSFSVLIACLGVTTYANLLSRGRNPSQAGIFLSCWRF